ncbi:putative serine/threonine-protein kinase DDB_G0284251 OS=Dictyostelium discoideum GN=DDB_G0284251 PE=3 SV=1 [Rhizoctonia solani AG-1 IB]|uniref:Putative serine/threonine-protein kinase DDB_G0284251 n=1 Tax=Thanatephorus cucumeris (strain AG1-IB / isolate 7/3/14) TaxID=1108050 RepID=A0A0B7FUB7_THACB|nr:putative serine/threonine-protein kinase DDB_G0284251 OS=Dictyostelium discoideum GN=DDB_G0284251 PE=3 SV=1 [Rhizoctonia solani AG-1 IB]
MLESHNINSPAPGSIAIDHNVPASCCWSSDHERLDTLLITTTDNNIRRYSATNTTESESLASVNSSAPSPALPSSPSLSDKVDLATEEIISSERRFVCQLSRLVDVYLPHLSAVFTESEIPSLVRNIQSIHGVHSQLANQLRNNQHSRDALCKAIVSCAPELTALHSEFWAGHSGAKALLSIARARDPKKWDSWEKERSAECLPEEDGSLTRTFEDLMVAPIWRVFTYHFLIEGLEDGSENAQVDDAIRAMQLVATSVDDTGRLREGEAYTKFILDRVKLVQEFNNADFLHSLGPCTRIGALEVVYREYATPPSPLYESVTPSLSVSQPTVASTHKSPWSFHPRSPRGKHLIVLLWKGYLVSCKIEDKQMRYEPKYWFPLRIDSTVECTSSTFPYGIRFTFGRHTFEFGAACEVDRDTWFHDIALARVSIEKGKELAVMSKTRIRRVDLGSKSESEILSIPGTQGLTRALSESNKWNRWKRSWHWGAQEAYPKRYERESSDSPQVGSASSSGARRISAATHKSTAKHLSSTDVFHQLLAHGCTDLTTAMDPKKYSKRSIARGAFADVWKGSLLDGTEVAIKVWRFDNISEDGPKSLKRAMREVYLWSKIIHPNIQELLGVILFQDRVGMVSPWRNHGNLQDYIKKHRDVDRYALCLQAVKGLAHLHDKNMVHGDLKACNMLVSEDEEVKISDFDHSILPDCTLAFSDTTNLGGGTLRWMAPELAIPDDEELPCQRDKKTDVYSLAMTCLEIITGKVPYAECSHDGAIYKVKHQKRNPNRPQELLGSDRNDAMWALLVQCWDHDPSTRPTAEEMLEKLEILIG